MKSGDVSLPDRARTSQNGVPVVDPLPKARPLRPEAVDNAEGQLCLGLHAGTDRLQLTMSSNNIVLRLVNDSE